MLQVEGELVHAQEESEAAQDKRADTLKMLDDVARVAADSELALALHNASGKCSRCSHVPLGWHLDSKHAYRAALDT